MRCRIESGRTREGSACLILTYPFFTRLIALIRVRKGCSRRIHRKIFRKKVAETLAGLKERRTFAPAIEKRRQVIERERDDLWGYLHNTTSSTRIGIEYIDESTVNEEDLGLRWRDGIRAEDIKEQFQQRRVWSWLRMNASDRLCLLYTSDAADER